MKGKKKENYHNNALSIKVINIPVGGKMKRWGGRILEEIKA